jgi:hypothetical protein
MSSLENSQDEIPLALSRWENEGGARPRDCREAVKPHAWQATTPELTPTELAHLRARIIALENLTIFLLGCLPAEQLERVSNLANFIVSRPEVTRHPLTIRAAALMKGFLGTARSGQTPNDDPRTPPDRRFHRGL